MAKLKNTEVTGTLSVSSTSSFTDDIVCDSLIFSDGGFRAHGYEAYTSGVGAEIRYLLGEASLLGYNRDTTAYIPVNVNGSSVKLMASGVVKATIDATDADFSDLDITTTGSGTFGGTSTGQSTINQGLIINNLGGSTSSDTTIIETGNVATALKVNAETDIVEINTGLKQSIRTITSSTTGTYTDIVVLVAPASDTVYTLPSPTEGRTIHIKKISDSYNVDVAPNSSENIDGVSNNKSLLLNETITLVSDGTNWWII